MIRICASFIILLVGLNSCSPSRHVLPLGRNERAVSISAGGPIVKRSNVDFASPLPLSSISYAFGASKKVTRIAAVHITPMLYGVYHLEGGFLRELVYNKRRKTGISANLMGNFIIDQWDWNFKFYPQIDINFFWHFKGDSHFHCDCPKDRKTLQFLYIGSTNWLELDRSNEYDIKEGQRFLLNPHLGYNIGSKKTKLNFEMKYYLPYVSRNRSGINYNNSPNNYGALGLTIALYQIF